MLVYYFSRMSGNILPNISQNNIKLSNLEFSEYLKLFLKRFINFGFVIGSFFVSSYVTMKNKKFFDDLAIDKKQDISQSISSKNFSYIIYLPKFGLQNKSLV